MQDNDPKHVSKQPAKGFLKTHKLTELPNANPIEKFMAWAQGVYSPGKLSPCKKYIGGH